MFALMFPGQGSQKAGMGAAWIDHPSWAVVDRISEASGLDVSYLLTEADAETLRQTKNAQPATFALSMVILDAAREQVFKGRDPVTVAGHSLGEYSALVAAGALTESDGARLVAARGAAMQMAAEELPGTMAAILGGDPELAAQACEGVEGAWVANDNAPGQVVIAGTAEGIAAASDRAKELGAKRVMPLAVGGAFHSPLMKPAQERLDAAIDATSFTPATIQVVTNVDAAAHSEGFGPLLSGQLEAPVRWRESALEMARLGASLFVEMGAGAELSGMVKRTVEGTERISVGKPEDLDKLAAALV